MRRRTWLSVAVAVAGCVAGYRGKAAFSGRHDIVGIEEVRIDLPDTPIDVIACTPVEEDPELCPEVLTYRGVWDSVAGTRGDAESIAATPTLQFVRSEGFSLLSAEVPLSVLGLVNLELQTLTLPDDRDVQIDVGIGDVLVDGVRGTVTVDLEAGEVEILGGDEGIGVSTGNGSIHVVTPGHADLRTGRGNVEVTQELGARDLFVATADGNIVVQLPDDTNVELHARAPGTIRIDTPQITTVAEGHFDRRLGTGEIRIELYTDLGSITVRGP